MLEEYRLAGKTALITGASRSSGIGAAVARILASCGANIVTTYYRPYDVAVGFGENQGDAALIIHELRSSNVAAFGLEIDLADVTAPKTIFDRAEQEIGPVDILVNNATVDFNPTDIYTLTPELFDLHYNVNMRGAVLLCAEFANRHNGRPGGRIINLTSGQGLHPMPDNLPYAMTKAAIECMTTCLSVSLSAKNITVNAVDPGATDTGWMTNDLKEDLKQTLLYNRVGMPDDAARLIAFLASSQAEWITGQILHSRGAA
ncbi:MAG: SDR family oxidoreductase [Capsulimonas sp.]|uniref:SDR family oxidoreductase n=1 Tax=Capsulimonas sp. TaxID=2494211 RepID=UPI0032648B90